MDVFRWNKDKCMWHVLLLLVTCCCCLPLVVAQLHVTSCLPPNQATPSNHPMQPSLPNGYNVMVEVTVEGKNSTEHVQEIVDGEGNRAAITLFKNGVQSTILFSYETSEIIYISGETCAVKNMSTDPNTRILFGEMMIDGLAHIPNGPSTLFFGSEIAKVYKGKAVVRGILCDWWHTCIVWPDTTTENIFVDYYFSVKSWNNPSLFSPAPVRYNVSGSQSFSNGTVRQFNRMYDFFDFIPDADSDPTVFQTPDGIACPGRKNTKTMPQLTSRYYHFREEIVDFERAVLTYADVWYDLDSQLVRVDYRSSTKLPPLHTTDPVSVIHDFRYGVSYNKDVKSGLCTPRALYQNTFDARFNAAAYLANGTYVMHMKDQAAFFFLDSNFTYTGMRTTRDVQCDVYISERHNIDFYNNGSALDAKVEAYFVSDVWADIPVDSDKDISQNFPVRVELWIPKPNVHVIYNLFDFDTERPEISVYDVSDCYDDEASIRFRVRFPGPYKPDTEHAVKVKGQDALVQTMQVSPLRVDDLQVEYDFSYLYITVTLLDRTPSLAQFTHLPKAVVERRDDFSFSNINGSAACSDLCVTNTAITCLSFEYCPQDRSSCRLSSHHVSDGDPTIIPSTCDLYSRTVDVQGSPELTVEEAFRRLKEGIKTLSVDFYIEEDTGQDMQYIAVDAEILFGKLDSSVLPMFSGQFSYRMEIVYPRHKVVDTYDIWYDSVSKLVRLDSRNPRKTAPYYTRYTISSIHDFNAGVAYNIDRGQGNCTVTALSANHSFDVTSVNWTHVHDTGSEILSMKTPYELFYLDNSYTFTGQKTVRGILCDVFESRRTDFHFGPGKQISIFQFFFQSKTWEYIADTHVDVTLQQPVKLVIMDAQANEFIVYNFYDFNDQHTSYDMFDVTPCFPVSSRQSFGLDFNQTYHPYLDTAGAQFMQEVRLLVASESHVSPLRVQNMQVVGMRNHTYIFATMLDQVAATLHFAETGVSSPYQAYVETPESDVTSCANDCLFNTKMICNSFDLCPDGTCYLSRRHVPDGVFTNSSVTCRHFSRTINGTVPEPSGRNAIIALKDVVFKGLFNVKVPIGDGSQEISFTASGIRTYGQGSSDTDGKDLESKFHLFRTGKKTDKNTEVLAGLAVDECATACLHEHDFVCDAFTYCYTSGHCYINANRPGSIVDTLTTDFYCDIYTRLYLDNYQKYPGQTVEGKADSTLRSGDPEDCAHQCSVSTAFTCRSFDVCPSTGDCLLYHVHDLDPGIVVNSSSFCSHYSRTYLADFSLQALTIVPGNDDTVIEGVTPQSCAYECAKDKGCQSFEFCDTQCRLSSVLPSTTILTHSDTCDLYSLSPISVSTPTSSSNVPPVTSTSTNTHSQRKSSPVHQTDSSGKAPAVTTTASDRPGPPSPLSSPTARPSAPAWRPASSAVTKTSTSGAGCNQHQTGGGSTDDTGPRVGIAFGVLVLGTLLGAALVLLVQRLWSRRQTDMAMELVPRMR